MAVGYSRRKTKAWAKYVRKRSERYNNANLSTYNNYYTTYMKLQEINNCIRNAYI